MKQGQIRQDTAGNRYLVIGQQPDKTWALFNLKTKSISFACGRDMEGNTAITKP
jgi:hypothetical protein